MSTSTPQRVVVLGASANPARMSYQAVKDLKAAGHEVIPVHPAVESILGSAVITDLQQVHGQIETVCMYVNAERSSSMSEVLCELKPGRVIFNPGAENPELKAILEASGISTLNACTLVMLKTDEF
jgi:predicted CoA-binding protein